MKETIVIGCLLAMLIGFMAFIFLYRSNYTLAESQSSTTLPLTSNQWTEIKLDGQGTNTDTYVLELAHGWLVYRSAGFGAGMAFVPKPDKHN